MSVGTRRDPYLDFRFHVQIDSLVVAGFSEVSGLEAELGVEEYEEGGTNAYVHRLPTRFSYPPLTLRRGLTASVELHDWLARSVHGPVERRDGQVVLLDARGVPQWGWSFTAAYPVTWTGPDLQAGQGSVAIETLELVHNGLSKMEGLPPG